MRRRCSLGNLASRAEALVGESSSAQIRNGIAVKLHPVALTDRIAVPVEAQRSNVAQLRFVVLRPRGAVEIFEAP